MGTHPIFESDFDCLTENMCAGGFYCTRLSLTFLNILYLAVSFIIIGVAGYFRNVGIIVSTPLVGGILALGVMLTFISLLGIMATLRHHQVLLFFYVLVLFILFIVQFAVSISCLALSHLQQMEVVRTAWTNVRDDVREDAMRTLQCCGFDNQDYMDTWQERSDETNSTAGWCVREGIPVPPKNAHTFDYEYCQTKIEENIDMAVEKTGGVSLFFSFGQMVGVWLAIRYRTQSNPAGPDPRAFGSD